MASVTEEEFNRRKDALLINQEKEYNGTVHKCTYCKYSLFYYLVKILQV